MNQGNNSTAAAARPYYIQSSDHYVLVPAEAVSEITVNYPPISAIQLRRDTALLRMRNVADALCAKMIANDAVVGLDRIAQRDGETATVLLFTDPKMDYFSAKIRTGTKPDVARYCKAFAETLGGGSVCFHRDHHAYDGVLSRLTLPLNRLLKQWPISRRRRADLPWNSFTGVTFEAAPGLALLLACLSGDLVLQDVAHVGCGTLEQWFAVYDRVRPPHGYTGNAGAQHFYYAAIDAVRA